ncbi:polysaccharide pyruvyl transferase family protein [Pseudovibrio sp. SCP19]|uniref:polysaccharide pyruvyl transferase family protein n=1 Tax=Pseudovibrio sp. SCP19 TaxID=3141374 RepID=UPI0033362036
MVQQIKNYWKHLRIKAGLRKEKEAGFEYERVLVRTKKNGLPVVRLLGSHSNFHCGCAAVMKSLRRAAEDRGWRLATFIEPYDAVVVNGEGSMHHSREHFHKKMGILQRAVEAGVPAYLINTVWQDNSSEYNAVLKQLAGIQVREKLSQRELLEKHGVDSNVCIDASFFYGPTVGPQDEFQRSGVAYTDFRCPDTDVFLRNDELLPHADYVSLKAQNWEETIRKLSEYEYVVTGQHHAVYAACKARTPFIASEGNSHKIKGLIESADAEIPTATSFREFKDLLENIEKYRSEYEKLFDWMARQSSDNLFPEAKKTMSSN